MRISDWSSDVCSSDLHGRKPILIIALIITTVTTFACAAAETFQHLAALRFLAGVGLGGALVTVIALAAASIGPQRRASAVTFLFIGFPLGAGLGGALTSAVRQPGYRKSGGMGKSGSARVVPGGGRSLKNK